MAVEDFDGVADGKEPIRANVVRAKSLIHGITDDALEALVRKHGHTEEDPTLWYMGSGASLVIFTRPGRQVFNRYQSRIAKDNANVSDEAMILLAAVCVWPDSKRDLEALVEKYPGRPGNVGLDVTLIASEDETKRAKKVPRRTSEPTKT